MLPSPGYVTRVLRWWGAEVTKNRFTLVQTLKPAYFTLISGSILKLLAEITDNGQQNNADTVL